MKAGEFIQKTFHVRTSAHNMHLKTKNYSSHKALQNFYEELLDLIDAYAEGYQGKYGLIEEYPGVFRQYATPMDLVESYVDYVNGGRTEFYAKEDTFLANIVDEIVHLSYKTLYKLKNLK
jgi:hypothetical protein